MTLQKESPVPSRACRKRVSRSNYNNQRSRKQEYSFAEINMLALDALPALLNRWLPDGRQNGQEYIARNPRRDDRRAGSFSINIHTGRWADFATGDSGGDVISLTAYLFDLGQSEAKKHLSKVLGVNHD